MRSFTKLKLWCDYLSQKTHYASILTFQKYYAAGLTRVAKQELWITLMKYLLQEKMTYMCPNKGSEMMPTISAQDMLVVRKFLWLETDSRLRSRHEQIYVGDVVVLRDPFDPNNYLVRRLAALSGHEMVSTNEEDEPFVVEDGQCWVLSDNQNLKPEESKDSRTYGPFSITNILGRVMYRFQSYEDNGVVVNSELSMLRDMPLLYAESSEISLSLEKDEESKGPQT